MIDPTLSQTHPERTHPHATTLAISANFTAEPVRAALALWAQQLHAHLDLRFAPFNQILQTLLDPTSEFAQNQHGANIVLCRYEDLAQPGATPEQLEALFDELLETVRQAPARLHVPLIFCLCPSSPDFAEAALAAEAKAKAEKVSGLHVLTFSDILALYPVDSIHDPEAERLAHIPYTEAFFAALATALARRVHSLYMPPYKVIAVDCDNTLWQGICGEDGPTGVSLDEPRRALHHFLLRQRDAGMLLVLASKNNEQDVFDTFAAHPEFPLQLEHFTAWRLNWDSKAASLISLADELNLGLDSFIFLDDNSKECAEVAGGAPEVLPLVLPEDIDDLPAFLDHVWAFDHPLVTEEDRQRSARYSQTLEFDREANRASSLEEFIAGLNLRVDFQPLEPERLGRVAQLTQRTNQFNTTTIRRTEADIQTLLATSDFRCHTVEVSDRFGDYGLVGVLMVQRRVQELFVDTFLLSCRALGRGVEHRMLSALAEEALDHGIYTVSVHFRPSSKNAPARQFLDSILHSAGERLELEDGLLYRFPATTLQSLRWKPGRNGDSAHKPKPRPRSSAARSFTGYAAIAHDLRSPHQVIAALRRQNQPCEATLTAPGAPVTPTQLTLARIWSELLERPVSSTTENFFDLGGHSLLAVLLLLRVKEEFAVELSVDDVYSGSLTLDTLASTIEARQLGSIAPEEYQALLAEIEGLSDEEVRALLDEAGPEVA